MAQITQEELMRAMQAGGASGGLLQAMQARLDGLVGKSSGLIETLPKPIQRRIKYLQSLQEDYDEKEREYERELDELDKKYEKIYAPIFAKRAEVVKGKVDAPADIVLGEEAADADETGPAGVPEFWVGVLRANEVTAAQITEKDEEVLEYLVDIRSRELDGEDECGFEITFEFAENPFFENTTLVKTYHMVDSDDPVLEKATGTKIEWKSGKNVTVKVMKKKPKPGKGGKASKPITKTEPVASFFSFFSPPKVPEGDEELDEDDMEQLQAALEEDYEIGEVIRDQLIPNAVSWYTGEAGEDEDEDEEDEDEDDDDDEEDDDDDEDSEEEDSDEDGAPKIKAAKAPTDAKEQPAECKQQ